MLIATIHLDLDCDFALSELETVRDRPFAASQCEVVDEEYIKFVIEAGSDRAAVETILRANEAVDSVERIDDSRVLITKRSSGAIPIIRENHGMLQQMSKFDGTTRVFDVVVFYRQDLQDIIAGLRSLGSVRLDRLKPFRDETTPLSSRQSEAIELALEAGYFDWPRRVDVETLADQLDITHSTFLEHLRKAEKKLLLEALGRAALPA